MPGTRKRGARAATRSKARRSPKVTRIAIPALETTLRRGTKRNLIVGAAAVAAGAAIAGAFVMRLQIGKLAKAAAEDAVSIGHSVGGFGHRVGKSLGREITELDLERLLAYAGLKKRPSLVRRLLPPMGALAALVAAGGSALFLVRSERGEAGDDAPLQSSKLRVPSMVKASTIGDSTPTHNSVGGAIGDVKAEVSHAIK